MVLKFWENRDWEAGFGLDPVPFRFTEVFGAAVLQSTEDAGKGGCQGQARWNWKAQEEARNWDQHFNVLKTPLPFAPMEVLFISPFWRQWNFIQVPMSCTESPVQCHAIRCLEPVRQLDRCQGASTSDHKPGRRLLSEKDLEIVPNLVN